ncbi:MAG: S8 family peptidase [Candidatus Helarchaeota archaeon]
MKKRKKRIFFAIFILFLILFPLVQIIFNVIPSKFSILDNKIKIIPKYFDKNLVEFNNPNNIVNKEKLDPFIKNMLDKGDLERKIPLIVYLNFQPGNSIALRLKNEEKMEVNKEYYQKLYGLTKIEIQNSQNQLISRLLKINATIKHKFSIINAISMEVPLKYINFLITDPNITLISYDYQLEAKLQYSVPSITKSGSNTWDLGMYNGSNVVIAVCDSGINETHPALIGSVIDGYNTFTGGRNADDDNWHGTYVAGIIANRDPFNHGVAPNVSLINVKVFDNTGTGPSSNLMAGVEWALSKAIVKPDIIHFSGGTTEASLYNGLSSLTLFVDAVTSMYNVLWINAAGNNGIIDLPADAYNSIAVGELYDVGIRDTNRNDDYLKLPGSGSGPTLDGRIKPDIVALGTNINSTWISGSWDNTHAGTSFSAPHISGAAADIYDFLNRNTSIEKRYYPLVTKALLLHTADDWSSTGPASDGPDSNTGWGYINLANTWNLTHSGVFLETNSLSYDDIYFKRPFFYNLTLNQNEILNITLVWNRHALYLGGLVFIYGNGRPNNLNLYLLNENLSVIDSSTDSLNNIEQISYQVPKTGNYYLKIICDDSQYFAAEPYAMVSTHNLSKVNPDSPKLLYYTLSPALDVDLDYIFFKSFDVFEKISLYLLTYDEDGIVGGTFNMPFLRNMFLPPIDYYFPIFPIFPNVLHFNMILEDLFLEKGINRLSKTFLDGSIWATFTIFDANRLSQSSSTFYIILDYHGIIWNVSIYAIALLTILIIIDFVRERRANEILKEKDETHYKKELNGQIFFQK